MSICSLGTYRVPGNCFSCQFFSQISQPYLYLSRNKVEMFLKNCLHTGLKIVECFLIKSDFQEQTNKIVKDRQQIRDVFASLIGFTQWASLKAIKEVLLISSRPKTFNCVIQLTATFSIGRICFQFITRRIYHVKKFNLESFIKDPKSASPMIIIWPSTNALLREIKWFLLENIQETRNITLVLFYYQYLLSKDLEKIGSLTVTRAFLNDILNLNFSCESLAIVVVFQGNSNNVPAAVTTISFWLKILRNVKWKKLKNIK